MGDGVEDGYVIAHDKVKGQWELWGLMRFDELKDIVATPLWGKCEVVIHTPENGTWESSGILENLECNCRG